MLSTLRLSTSVIFSGVLQMHRGLWVSEFPTHTMEFVIPAQLQGWPVQHVAARSMHKLQNSAACSLNRKGPEMRLLNLQCQRREGKLFFLKKISPGAEDFVWHNRAVNCPIILSGIIKFIPRAPFWTYLVCLFCLKWNLLMMSKPVIELKAD